MSKIEVNAIEPQSGTTLTLGASGDTITIPSGATINNQGSAVNFGPTGAVSWNTTKITANPNPAVSGVGYFCDTTSAAFTVTLPSSPSAGAVVGICDYANTFATNNLTVGRNGSNIGGVAENAKLKVNGVSVTFVYVDATQGWIVTDSGQRSNLTTTEFVAATGGTILTCGDFKTHVFTGPGSFVVSCAGNPQGSTTVDYLVVAGGGSGGYFFRGSGGGAGGFRLSNSYGLPAPTMSPLATPTGITVSATTYPITVGAGAASPTTCTGNNGSNSVFSTITSAGGGGTGNCGPVSCRASAGGSGGGRTTNTPSGSGAAGNTPPVNPPQGNPGGGISYNAPNFGGGGGGAGAAGSSSVSLPVRAATGGIGSFIDNTFLGPTAPNYGEPGPVSSTRYFAGGGGAGSYPQPAAIAGGIGGGGDGGYGCSPYLASTAGSTNMGGGGGGQSGPSPTPSSSAGGSGIVIIRYKFQ
jgi:hypothetical protein